MCDNVSIFDTFCASCCLGESRNTTRHERDQYDDETTPLLRECDLAQVGSLQETTNAGINTISTSSSTIIKDGKKITTKTVTTTGFC